MRHALQYAEDADQVEFDALKWGGSAIVRGVHDEQVSGVLDDLANDLQIAQDLEPWQRADLIRDDSIGGVHEEILRRESLLKGTYPFELDGGTLRHRSSLSLVYEFLLAVSISADLVSGEYVRLPRTFERIAATLIARYLGPNAKSLHVGFPRDKGESFAGAMAQLHRLTAEWRWDPEDSLKPADAKDEGCDFVVWLEPSDGRRIGQLFLLGQCACGNNWQDKYDDLSVRRLQKWFHPMSLIEPVRSFTTPRHVPDEMLRESSRRAGLFFDRARLCRIAGSGRDGVLDKKTETHMKDLIDIVCHRDA